MVTKKKKKGPLNAEDRKRLPKTSFASPEGTGDDKSTNAYPIDTKERAVAALARVEQHGSPEEKRRVLRAVCKKYPDLPACEKLKNQDKQVNDGIRAKVSQ